MPGICLVVTQQLESKGTVENNFVFLKAYTDAWGPLQHVHTKVQ